MTNELVKYEQLKVLVKTEEVQERFREVIGQRSQAFLASVINSVYLDANLKDADPNTVLSAALKAAILDLPIDPNLGQAYIIGYYNNKRKVKEAQFQMGYRGFIQLALRTSQYEALNTTEIYEGEEVIEDRLTGNIKLTGSRKSDEVVGFVAYFRLHDGFEKFVYMSKDDVHTHAARYSKSYKYDSSPWQTHFDEMGKKTVIKKLLSKYGILTITLNRAMNLDTNGDEEAIDASFIEDRVALADADPETGEIAPPPYGTNPPPPDLGISVADATTVDEPEPEQVKVSKAKPPKSPKKPVKQEDVVYQEAVTLGYAATIQSAKAAMKGCTVEDISEKDTLAWLQGYRGWLDMGAKANQAAKEMNRWNFPK
jgi:recombination protein RecT